MPVLLINAGPLNDGPATVAAFKKIKETHEALYIGLSTADRAADMERCMADAGGALARDLN
jgi:hypothetical protein